MIASKILSLHSWELWKEKLLIYVFVFLWPHLWHMEVPRLGVKSKLSLPAYTRTAVKQDPSHICNLHRSLWQHQIRNLLSKTRDWTWVLRNTSRGHFLSHDQNFRKVNFWTIYGKVASKEDRVFPIFGLRLFCEKQRFLFTILSILDQYILSIYLSIQIYHVHIYMYIYIHLCMCVCICH